MSQRNFAKISIITRTKNRPVLLKRAIESVLAQTYSDFLHVVVNDGGDRSEIERLMNGYKGNYENRLLLIHNDKSLGMEAASNVGIKASDGTYVTIHDDDDSWHPQFLAKMIGYLENNVAIKNLGGVVCYADLVREKIVGDTVSEVSRRSVALWSQELTLWRMCAKNLFPPIAFIYKREVYGKIGGLYREDLPVQGDWEFNLRFMQHYEIGLLKDHLAFYHFRNSEKNAHNIYSNSVEVTEKHRFYNTYLRNEFLRKDLAENKLGVGFIMNLNPILFRLDRIASRLLEMWEKSKDRIARLRSLWPVGRRN
jgi:glycosyltransferase involved in cell wall biosynthesis